MQSFHKYIIQLIKINGPIPLDHFMQMATKFYYNSKESIGRRGDFITSPEISQLFGETIALWCIDKYLDNIRDNFYLIELGGGNGTMMSDILRIALKFNQFNDNLKQIFIVENSQHLKKVQAQTLSVYLDRITWVENISCLPKNNMIVVANEFLDALPIKQYQKYNEKFFEILIGVKDNNLTYQLAATLYSNNINCPHKGIIEVSRSTELAIESLIKLCINHRFCHLLIDYGYMTPAFTSTLQAVSDHQYHNILVNVGTADITAHVDFMSILNFYINKGFKTNVSTQGSFLKAYGIETRAKKIIDSGGDFNCVSDDVSRLTHNKKMGALFKVFEAIG